LIGFGWLETALGWRAAVLSDPAVSNADHLWQDRHASAVHS
jgi:hypothetical protein